MSSTSTKTILLKLQWQRVIIINNAGEAPHQTGSILLVPNVLHRVLYFQEVCSVSLRSLRYSGAS